MLLACLERRHLLSVLRASEAYPRGRNGRSQVEMTRSRARRSAAENARKVAKLARALASLDDQARVAPARAQARGEARRSPSARTSAGTRRAPAVAPRPRRAPPTWNGPVVRAPRGGGSSPSSSARHEAEAAVVRRVALERGAAARRAARVACERRRTSAEPMPCPWQLRQHADRRRAGAAARSEPSSPDPSSR